MSCAIPLIFKSITHNNGFYIDGGFLNAFPLNHCIKHHPKVDEILAIENNIYDINYSLTNKSTITDIFYLLMQKILLNLNKKKKYNIPHYIFVDKSVIYGFGLRFAILGLLEFIDWGGIDTLDNASSYMTKTMKSQRFSTPSIVKKHIKNNNLGLSTQSGFMDWKNIDVEKYQEDKLKNFVKVIKLLNIQPKIKI